MRFLSLVLLLSLGITSSWAQSPADAVTSAAAHVRTLTPGIRENVRYLTLYGIPLEDRADFMKALAFWVNSLSRELEIVRPRLVSPDLVAIDLSAYGWERKTWDKFADADPYFSLRISKNWPGGIWPVDGKIYAAGPYFQVSAAPWIPQQQIAELYLLTQSRAPILRADWWLVQTAIQDKRRVGYYDMLGLGKKLKDFEELAGLDRKLATKLRKEVAAIVSTSVVALHNRQLFRFATLSGSWWESRDAKNNDGQRNAIRFLNGDFQFDAQELYASLPNGLFAFFLADGQGNRVNTAPDDIASDANSRVPDRRVHVGLSCVRCHRPGIQPIDDWGRKAYAAPDVLQVVGIDRYNRLKQLYLTDLDKWVRRDQADYAEAVKTVNGLTPQDNAKLFAWAYERYAEELVTPEQAAREYGVPAEKMIAAFRAAGQFPRTIDPVLFGLGKGIAARREHFEELFGLGMEIIRSYQ